MTTKCNIYITEELQKKLLAEGKNADSNQELIFDCVQKKDLELFQISKKGELSFKIDVSHENTYSINDSNFSRMTKDAISYSHYKDSYTKNWKVKYWDHIPTYTEIITFVQKEMMAEEKFKQKNSVILEKRKELYQKRIKEIEEEENQNEKLKKEIAEKNKNEREAMEHEKISWIEKNGSEFLRTAVNRGYDCQRKYVTERAEIEFPGFVVDFDKNIDYNSRACPTALALKTEIELSEKYPKSSISVEWMTDDGKERDYYDNKFEQCEIILVSNYLKNYNLYKIV